MGFDLSKTSEILPIFALKVRNEITDDQALKKAHPLGGLAYLGQRYHPAINRIAY